MAIGNPLNPVPGVSDVTGTGIIDPRTQTAEQAQAVAVTVLPNEVRQGTKAEQAEITKWLREARVPSWLKEGWARWDADRKYLNEELFAEGTVNENKLTVNLAARAVQQKVSAILPYDADCSVRHERGVGSIEIARRDAIRRANGMMEAAGIPVDARLLLAAADQAERQYTDALEAHSRLAQTTEALVKKLWDEGNGTKAARMLASAGMTVGLAWLKVGWQRDYGRDCLSNMRNEEQGDQLKLLALRAAEFAYGVFGQEDDRYAQLIDLSEYARIVGQKVVGGEVEPGSIPFANWSQIADTRQLSPIAPQLLPEVEVWQGPTIDVVNPENLRWDWSIPVTRFLESPWVMEQFPMNVDDCAAEFGLTPAERDLLANPALERRDAGNVSHNALTYGGEAADPSRGDYESQVQRGKVIVWERIDRRTQRRTVFVEGLPRFLINEVIRNAPKGVYRYIPIYFNDLDGAHLPHSDVRFMRKIQDAINQRLTDSQESLWASMKRYLVRKGAFRDGELAKLKGAKPHDVIEVEDPDGIKDSFKEIASDDWRADKYDLSGLFRLFELVSGMSISQLGVTGQANFAAEANIAQQSAQAAAGRHGMSMAEALTRAMDIIRHDAGVNLSERQVKFLVGDAGYWPAAPSRMELMRGLRLKVEAAGSRQAAKMAAGQEAREAMTALRQALDLRMQGAAQGVTVHLNPLIRAITHAIDVEAPARDIIQIDDVSAPPPQMAMQAGPPGPPGQPNSPPGPAPADGPPG
jgi:hypothetical protein